MGSLNISWTDSHLQLSSSLSWTWRAATLRQERGFHLFVYFLELKLLPFRGVQIVQWNYFQFLLSEPCHDLFYLSVFNLRGPMNFISWIYLIRGSCLSFSLGTVPGHHPLANSSPGQVSIFLPAFWFPALLVPQTLTIPSSQACSTGQ